MGDDRDARRRACEHLARVNRNKKTRHREVPRFFGTQCQPFDRLDADIDADARAPPIIGPRVWAIIGASIIAIGPVIRAAIIAVGPIVRPTVVVPSVVPPPDRDHLRRRVGSVVQSRRGRDCRGGLGAGNNEKGDEPQEARI